MSALVPFPIWVLLGFALGWWLRGMLGRKLGFLKRVRRPFGQKKAPSRENDEPDQKEEGMFGKITSTLARPIEKLMGDDKDDKGKKK